MSIVYVVFRKVADLDGSLTITDRGPASELKSKGTLSFRILWQSKLPSAAERRGNRSVSSMAASAGLRGNRMVDRCFSEQMLKEGLVAAGGRGIKEAQFEVEEAGGKEGI